MTHDSDWVAHATSFYSQRGRVLRARRWLPEELEEEFVAECMFIEVAERQAARDSELTTTEPDRIRITTRALSAIRRTVRTMPWSIRSRLEHEPAPQSLSEAKREFGVDAKNDQRWDNVQFVVCFMDVVCAMHWLVWLSRKRSKPKGTGYTVRTLAAVVGVSRMKAARTIAAFDDWFKRLWEQQISGEVRRVRSEIENAESLETSHFSNTEADASCSHFRSPYELNIDEVIDWLIRCAILPDLRAATDLVEKSIALGLLGENGRYLIAPDNRIFSLGQGGQRNLIEDLGSLATCRRQDMSWHDLAGLQAMISQHLQWVARVEDRDLKKPGESRILRNIETIEEILSQHPLGLQYWGTAFGQNRVVSPALRVDS